MTVSLSPVMPALKTAAKCFGNQGGWLEVQPPYVCGGQIGAGSHAAVYAGTMGNAAVAIKKGPNLFKEASLQGHRTSYTSCA